MKHTFSNTLVALTGRDPTLIRDDRERHRFAAVGGLMAVTTALAAVSGYLTATRTLAAPAIVAVLAGVVVGGLVFALDTVVVTANRDHGRPPRAARVAASLVLCVVLGHALLGEILASSIRPFEVTIVNERARDAVESNRNADRVATIDAEIDRLERQIETATAANAEADTAFRKIPTSDPPSQEWWNAFGRGMGTSEDLTAIKAKNEPTLEDLRADRTSIQKELKDDEEKARPFDATTAGDDAAFGLVVEVEAMYRLARDNGAALIAILATLAVLLTIDLSVLATSETAIRNSEVDDLLRRAGEARREQDVPAHLIHDVADDTTPRARPWLRGVAAVIAVAGIAGALWVSSQEDRDAAAGSSPSTTEVRNDRAAPRSPGNDNAAAEPASLEPGPDGRPQVCTNLISAIKSTALTARLRSVQVSGSGTARLTLAAAAFDGFAPAFPHADAVATHLESVATNPTDSGAVDGLEAALSGMDTEVQTLCDFPVS